MRLAKLLLSIIILTLVAIVWYQLSYSDKWERLKYPLEFKAEIASASQKYSIDPYLIAAIIYVESKFNPISESRAGAVGLMQIMPNTGIWISKKRGTEFYPADLKDPGVNIDMGTWYFNYLKHRYGSEKLALAAYNSGYKNVDRWMEESQSSNVDDIIESIPYKETRDFIMRVEKVREIYAKLYPSGFKNLHENLSIR
ncbi:MAG: lytic transglycosylase domain-containing protein [Actinomycetota bacterium]